MKEMTNNQTRCKMLDRKTLFLGILFILLAGCGRAPAAPTAAPTTPIATSTAASTPPPTAVPALTTVGVDAGRYIDNRSDPVSVLQSLCNAINRQEYVRAYSYWGSGNGGQGIPPFEQFVQSYSDTLSVTLSVGPVGGSGAAGSYYYLVPAVLRVTKVDGTVWTFAGCYTLHQANPDIPAMPPYLPMSIDSADLQPAADSTELAEMAIQSCPAASPLPPTTPPPAGDASVAAPFLDDRSGAAEVIRSFYNAINHKQYSRAYSYWKESAAAEMLPPYPQFVEGYSTTLSVQLTTGPVVSDPGAGQLYYYVPAAMVATQTDGATRTSVGCYTLHLGQPSFQAVPPFQPLGITAAAIKEVDNSADLETLLGAACETIPAAAPTGELTPLDPANCSALADAMGQAISASIEITQAPIQAFADGQNGTACRLLATGTGVDFSNYAAVADALATMLEGQGWTEDMQYAAGGPTGMGDGYRRGTALCLLSSMWMPSADANCPSDQPISACVIEPEQQLYTITLDCAQGLAPAPPAWVALDSQSCTALAGVLGQTFGLTAVTMPDALFVDPVGSTEGTGCKATITGTEVLFTSPQAVVEKMTSAIQAIGWTADPQYVVGSNIGAGQGYRKDNGLCLLVATWQPSPDANCPPDKGYDECNLGPEQRIYTVELNCAQPPTNGP
jgi:hypothetical protein